MAAQTESRGGGGGEVKKLLSAVNDHYGCVIVHVTQHMDPATFVSSLTSSIAHWKLQGKKGVSIRLAIERVNLVEAAVKVKLLFCSCFSFFLLMILVYHAEPDDLMLVYWIPQSPHTLPTNATHHLQSWVGEDIFAAAVREVKEETGVTSFPTYHLIDSEFVEVVTVRYELYEVLVYQLGGAMWPRAEAQLRRRHRTTTLSMAAEGETSSESLVLSGMHDHYGGVIVHINDNDPIDPATFLSLLTSSIAHWKLQGKKGVWIKLPIERVNLVEVAVKEGFWYHHAEPKYLMLVYWIPQSSHTLPSNATHRVGIGAFVLNPTTRQVLAVQEKSGVLQGTGVWKFPTGVVDEGEDICVAAVREVKEETGVSIYIEFTLPYI
ncbi:nudix hydrolase 2-like [Pyrus ussuriensis x Pyrus communis]|uniref:Nudix hydrolase 2-like n=1 Tax=Pyrus ussuriensis x Pyrus communis TaxID=2448454 RepID=A0A5N5IS59_9ROSA|nr:nudix hydrolase 2-like [Pyrus ussuriensis x Pyrus communis]